MICFFISLLALRKFFDIGHFPKSQQKWGPSFIDKPADFGPVVFYIWTPCQSYVQRRVEDLCAVANFGVLRYTSEQTNLTTARCGLDIGSVILEDSLLAELFPSGGGLHPNDMQFCGLPLFRPTPGLATSSTICPSAQ
ncbi:MAG: hypothetical protein GY696_21385 [Gammaproteobacteria bacterium]|nr:hypothetical protein [Gammaproteobacteria bacterium]